MKGHSIGLLHPGDMGATIGAAAVSTGHKVHWAAADRSPATRQRADQAGLIGVNTLADICNVADVIISVCPPHGAVTLATQVAACGFSGQYLDANAISPARSEEVHKALGNGIDYIDGGIIGPPARKSGSTRLYLSGPSAAAISTLFSGSVLEAIPLEGKLTSASALKICYAAWTKGYAAMLSNIRALARHEQVEDALLQEWNLSQAGLREKSDIRSTESAHKAWRWIAEMHEIADSFEAAQLPDGFHRASAEVYRRLESFKDVQTTPEMNEIIEHLLKDV